MLEGASDHVADVEDLGHRADAYFDGDYPADALAYIQAMLRETWKDDHGSYSRWDRAARAGGVAAVGKIILGR